MEAAFAAHSDLHSGWEPTATVQTQLCTGDADKQVPATISLEAAERWPSASLIVLPGRGHNDAIVECSRLGLLNLTASLGVVAARTAARAPVILAPSNATLLYDGGGAAPAAPLLTWERLQVATVAVAAVAAVCLLGAALRRVARHVHLPSGASPRRRGAGDCGSPWRATAQLLLTWPLTLLAVASLAILLPTALQLQASLLQWGAKLFDLDVASFRVTLLLRR